MCGPPRVVGVPTSVGDAALLEWGVDASGSWGEIGIAL
jgi:hypothetical protein